MDGSLRRLVWSTSLSLLLLAYENFVSSFLGKKQFIFYVYVVWRAVNLCQLTMM